MNPKRYEKVYAEEIARVVQRRLRYVWAWPQIGRYLSFVKAPLTLGEEQEAA